VAAAARATGRARVSEAPLALVTGASGRWADAWSPSSSGAAGPSLFELEPEAGGTRLRQTAIFEPRGLGGLAYWYGLFPVQRLIFAGMLRGIASAASRRRG